ncbi:MAG: cohesin domain-containing protein [Desulfococcaceae bacterium]|jgi:hypothetical protein|nr:cohesin domain-containing protein [Desulfococcaceae bacterium]
MKQLTNMFCALCILLCCAGNAMGTEIIFPAAEVKAGQSVMIPVLIDKADNLAGVKLSLAYDKNLLTFQKADKSKEASSLMHIVNDKNPGFVIVVMAGAKGIRGENLPILYLHFKAKSGIPEKKTGKIEVKESQLMSDSLKDTEHKVRMNPLTILPALSAPPSAEDTGKAPAPPDPPAEKEIFLKKDKIRTEGAENQSPEKPPVPPPGPNTRKSAVPEKVPQQN